MWLAQRGFYVKWSQLLLPTLFATVWHTNYHSVNAEVVAAFVVPHGGVALDPSHTNFTNSTDQQLADALHENLMNLSQDVADQNPDIIFFSTPHGISDMDRFLIYLNEKAAGVTYADHCQSKNCAFNLNISLAANESLNLVHHLKKSHRVSGVSTFGPPAGSSSPRIRLTSDSADQSFDQTAIPLRWGEIIPLYFIPKNQNRKFIILSHPSRRYSHSESMIPELLHLGRSLYLRLSHLKERVAVIISADLAHTHQKDGPYGYSPSAQPFDDAVGTWLKTLDATSLLQTAAGYVNEALSCGYTGLVMLHGMLSEGGLKRWTPKLLINGHPTYFGMALASMKRS
ncbi:hypothetical protein RvY_05892 [Ramazzottius varieornatus]|uniref:Extradiol ring-cleavage dioxygenase class III enzyme subunit B domain-containing protein n=1 Tax=Ramazzottius varieornatus TaxID=947166 RepID=A0A1D1V696_RAMVA|nr:hypothetical protein RvY_05892 [Ramazzottius varieornatus]